MATRKTKTKRGARAKTKSSGGRRPYERKPNPNTAPTKDAPHGSYRYARVFEMYHEGEREPFARVYNQGNARRMYEKAAKRGEELKVVEKPRPKTGRRYSETSTRGMIRDAYASGVLRPRAKGGTTMRNAEAREAFLKKAKGLFKRAAEEAGVRPAKKSRRARAAA